MSDLELIDFELIRELTVREHRQIFHAIHRGDQKPVLLTVFSSVMSQRPEFRRAVKTDRAMLSMLQHQSIVRFLGSGESGGQLFYWTEICDFDCLTQQVAEKRSFSSEDVIEIGWQVCSALQQAHNLGLAHGGLSMDSILLSDNLQVMLTEFGIARWLRAAQLSDDSSKSGPSLITISALASREDVESDLTCLAEILTELLQISAETVEATEAARNSTKVPLERLLARLTSTNPASRPVSAREFQGRLGEILIGTDDDTMPLVDQREAVGKSRRSIVVELFEPTESISEISGAAEGSAGSAWGRRILPILVVLTALVIITMLAGLLWSAAKAADARFG